MVTECFASIQVVVEKIFLHLLSANFLETESADFILLPGICTGGKWSVHRHIYVYVCYAYMLISLSKIGDRESKVEIVRIVQLLLIIIWYKNDKKKYLTFTESPLF